MTTPGSGYTTGNSRNCILTTDTNRNGEVASKTTRNPFTEGDKVASLRDAVWAVCIRHHITLRSCGVTHICDVVAYLRQAEDGTHYGDWGTASRWRQRYTVNSHSTADWDSTALATQRYTVNSHGIADWDSATLATQRYPTPPRCICSRDIDTRCRRYYRWSSSLSPTATNNKKRAKIWKENSI